MIGFFCPPRYTLDMSVAALKEALAKLADNGKLDNNEDRPTTGVMNVYPPPQGRSPGTLDAKWGDKPTDSPNQHGTGVEREAKDDRQGVAERSFDSLTAAKAEAQATVAQNTGEGWGDYESHSLLLQKNSHYVPERLSLTDRVRKLTGT